MTRKPSPSPLPPGSVKKERIFRLLVILFPLLVLGLGEVSLRWMEYGGNLDLVVTRRVGNREVRSINRGVATRYFSTAGIVVPEPADDVFGMTKSDSTIRIFCLGESTMAGFPYDFNATAPSFLRDRMTTLFPGYTIEVVNIGLSAISSYIVRDLVRELSDYEPDLFVLYLGHNEFYGIYGTGSSVRIPGGRWMTNLHLSLLDFKTYLLLRDLIGTVRASGAPVDTRPGATLMEQMVRENIIPYRSDPYNEARDVFRENLHDILTMAGEKEIPVLVSALVSNQKDHPPFRSVFGSTTPPETREEWQRQLKRGEDSLRSGRLSAAEQAFRACIQLDSLNALSYYRLGQGKFQSGEFEEAKGLFLRARDLDALRFRASEDFAADLRSVCRSLGIPVAPVDSVFEQHSPHGIVGAGLMLEHLHPNVEGYFLMAKTFARTILENDLLRKGKQDSPHTSDAEYWEMSRVTEFDRTVGSMKVDLLTHKWPFVQSDVPHRITPGNRLEELALRYVEGKIFWSTARYELAAYYATQREYEKARRECLAVSKVIPFSHQPLLMVADFYRMEGDRNSARQWYELCIAREDNPYARFKLAILLLEDEQAERAIIELQAGFRVATSSGISLTNEATAASYYLLGVAYAKQGKFDEAAQHLQRSLSYDPKHQDARDLLQQLAALTPRR